MEKNTEYYDWEQFFKDDEGTTSPKIGDGAPRYVTAETLDRAVLLRDIEDAFEDRSNGFERFFAGMYNAALEHKTLKDSLVILGGQALMSVGGVFGEDNTVVEYGRSLVQSGARNLEKIREENERWAFWRDKKRGDSFVYKLGSGTESLGVMLVTGYLTGGIGTAVGLGAKAAVRAGQAAALTVGAAAEASSEVQEGVDTYRERTGDTDLSQYTPKEATKEVLTTGLYTAGATALEGLNLSKLLRVFKPKGKGRIVKSAVEGALSEGITEAAQEGLNVFFDKADGTINWEHVPERLKGALVQGAVGSIVGGSTAGAFSVYHRARGIEAMEEYIGGTVENDAERTRIATEAWDDLQDGANTLIAKELIYDESLRNKHGDIYNAMQRAIARAADESGAFADADETARAQYIDETARMFADQTLAEANQRGVSIDEVLKSSDIGFHDGAISLDFGSVAEGVEAGAELEQAMFKSPIQSVGEFYDSVVSGQEERPRYFPFTTPSGTELGLPDYVVRHDINGHNLTRGELENVFDNLENVEAYGVSDKETELAKRNLLLKVKTPQGIYGVSVALGENRNFVSTVFKSTGERGVDSWIEKEASRVPSSQPTATDDNVNSVATSGKPLKDIISEARSEINGRAETAGSIDAAAAQTEKGYRMYQTSDLTERADGPKISGDAETVDVVEIPENAVPKFEKTADLRNWLIGRFNEIGSVTIEATKANVDFNVTAAQRVVKNARQKRNNIAYPEIEKVVSGAKYSGFREADGRHQAKVKGQDVYHSAVIYEGRPYSVEFYVDVPLTGGRDNFAGNRISRIEIAPSGTQVSSVKQNPQAGQQGAIHTISMGVLRGKVKPARLRDGGLSQRKTVRSAVIKGSFDPSERVIRITKNADYSTLPHEFAHYWLTLQKSWYDSGAASEAYQERMRIALDWLGVNPWKSIGVRAQEKFARGYEAYLLKGDLPESPLNPAFKEYDKWLKEVYNGANRPQKEPLTEDMVRFFDSMTTGLLPPPVKTPVNVPSDEEKPEGQKGGETPAVAVETQAQAVSSEQSGAEKTGASVRAFDTARESDAETGLVSRAAERQQEIAVLQGKIAEDEMQNVYYTPITLEEQAGRAFTLMQNEGADAVRDMIDGKRDLPEGVMRVPAMIAYEEEMLRRGNLSEYSRVLKKHTLEQTRRGQEIVSERLAGRDISDLRYWFKRVVSNKKAAAAEKFKKLFQKEGGEKGYNNYLRRIADRTANAVIRTANAYERRAVLNEALREAEAATGKKADLSNVNVAGEGARLYDRIYDAVAQEIDALFEATLSVEETKRLFEASVQLKTAYADDMAATPNGNPSVEVMRLLKEMTDTANAMAPSNALALGVNVWGRAAMLASVKTPFLNIESNLVGAVTEGMIRRARLRSWDKAVDPKAIADYSAYDAAVYDASGITASTVRAESILEPSLFGAVKGERVLTTQGEGRVRAASRFAENVIFKWSLGKPDAVFKRWTFVDNADLEATKIAKAEGYEGDALKKRATEIFNDAVLFNPQTPEGRGVRERSVAAAEIVTYTNDGLISRFSLKARELLNDATGNARIGDIVMPFVKTPANVAALGLEYSAGFGRLLLNAGDILRDVRNRSWSAQSQSAVNAAVRNGVGGVLALLLVALFDPEDYISSFDLASPKERDLARMKNAPFNSVKIGGQYVSLDYFGPLAAPMAAVLEARKQEGILPAAYEYVKTALVQASGNIPAIEGLSSAVGAGKELSRMDADALAEEVMNNTADAVLSRLVPAIVGDVAKVLDGYERDMKGASVIDKAAEKLPFVREALPVRFNTATGRPKESSLAQLFFGSRLKEAEENDFVKEINRLHESGNSPVLSDVTRTRAFSSLTAEEKAEIRAEFNGGFRSSNGRFVKGYPEQAAAMIKSVSYGRAGDARKKQALDKLRRRIVEEIKEKHGIARRNK